MLDIYYIIHSYITIYNKSFKRPKWYWLTRELDAEALSNDLSAALEDGALLTEALLSFWEQHAASCWTLLLLMLADAPLAEEDLDKQVVPGCSCTLFCFADEWLTSSSQEQIVAARLARRPLLPTGVAEAFERGGLEGEAAFSSDGIGEKCVPSNTSSENVFRKIKSHIQQLFLCIITCSTHTEFLRD